MVEVDCAKSEFDRKDLSDLRARREVIDETNV